MSQEGIFLWKKNKPNSYKIVYDSYINAGDHFVACDDTLLLLNYNKGCINAPTIKYFTNKIELFDSLHLQNSFNEVKLCGSNLIGIDSDENAIIKIDIRRKEKIYSISLDSLSRLLPQQP